jgi:hypothetical protein
MSTNYIEKVKKIRTSDLMGYWPLNEESGTAVLDHSPKGENATSASLVRIPATRGFTAPDGGRCAEFATTGSMIDIYGTFSSTIAVAEGTLMAWVAMPSTALNSTTKQQIVILAADTANAIGIDFDTTANRFSGDYFAGAADATYSTTYGKLVYNDHWAAGRPLWHQLVLTYSVASDCVVLYVDAVASTGCSTLGAWTGAFASTACSIGSTNPVTKAAGFTGHISHVAWWKTPLTKSEVEELYKAGP